MNNHLFFFNHILFCFMKISKGKEYKMWVVITKGSCKYIFFF